MKNLFKQLVSGVVTLAVMSFSVVSAFAADVETNDIETAEAGECIMVTATSEGITSITDANGENLARGAIYGYGYGCLRSNNTGIVIYPDGNEVRNMNLTIKTQSTWNGDMYLYLADSEGRELLRKEPIKANKDSNLIRGLKSYNPGFFLFVFDGIPDGVEVHTWIWIYD